MANPSIKINDTLVFEQASGVSKLSNNVTIDSGVTFPTGKLVNAGFRKHTGGNMDTVSQTLTVSYDYESISCTAGNTIMFGFMFQFENFRTTSDATQRKGVLALYQNTSLVSANATSGLGTELFNSQVGRTLTGNSGQAASTFDAVNISAVFEATATTHYLGLARAGFHDAAMICRIYRTTDNPLYFYFYEFQGDILS